MQNQDSGATADAYDGSRCGREDDEDDENITCPGPLDKEPPEKATPYSIKRCQENQVLEMIRINRPGLLPPIQGIPSDDQRLFPFRHSRRMCSSTNTPKVHRHVEKSDITRSASDRVAFVGMAGSSTGTSLCRGAHHSVPVRRHEGTNPSGCLGVLPFVRRESLECVAEEDDTSVDGAKSMVGSDLEAVTSVNSSPPSEQLSTRVLARPPTPVPKTQSDSFTPGCSTADKHLDTDEAKPTPKPNSQLVLLRDSSSEDSTLSTTSSEWSAILEKVKALEQPAAALAAAAAASAQTRILDPVTNVGSCCCRICQSSNNPELLISPCRCKGSLAYVHLSCLERWLNQSGRTYCELCQFRFNAIQTPRYRLLKSMRLWYCHPRHRRQLFADSLIAVILTCVTLGLVSIIVLGMRYFILEGAKLGISAQCTEFTVTFFLAVVTSGYIVTMYLLVKDEACAMSATGGATAYHERQLWRTLVLAAASTFSSRCFLTHARYFPHPCVLFTLQPEQFRSVHFLYCYSSSWHSVVAVCHRGKLPDQAVYFLAFLFFNKDGNRLSVLANVR